MTNKSQQIEVIRKKVICAVHNADDYDKALGKELGLGCRIQDCRDTMTIISVEELSTFTLNDKYKGTSYLAQVIDEQLMTYPLIVNYTQQVNEFSFSPLCYENYKIIGKPLTLDRVLVALKVIDIEQIINVDTFGVFWKEGNEMMMVDDKKLFEWNLTKPTLEEQSDETILSIYKLLCDDPKK